ncbi:MAG: preprotein translocase subunit SecY [Alphaproteobacteria bacterium]|jgi:preprotein translocase subunit SecY|nr:preprotein translocase subunit SecY [Alphaproteobacteria bacterium]MCV6599564.1 preprotein translocase subunit SecY [Alphaproteobacteria bacterium]
MSSVSEQLANNFSFASMAKATDLKKKIIFTLLALIVFRLGSFVPVPGVDAGILASIFEQNQGGILGMFDMFSGGSLRRMTIFALGVMPYISASIVFQLLTAIYPPFIALKKEGAMGFKKINQYTRYATIILAMLQGWGLAVGMEAMTGPMGSAVVNPGFFFRFSTMVNLVGGTVFLMWLGEQITARGIGNGISLIIFSGIVAALPASIAGFFEMGKTGAISTLVMMMVMALAVGLVFFIVFMEKAHRRVLVQYPRRQVGNKMFGGDASHIPLKINVSGVIPPIFASSLLLLPLTLIGFLGGENGTGPEWLADISAMFQRGSAMYMIVFSLLVLFFTFFYATIVFNPDETADNLKQYGGFVPGIRPGKNTADFLHYLLNRLAVIGSVYLIFICLLPEFLIAKFNVPFYLGGTSLLIVISVMMDTVAQIHSHLISHQYEGLLKKTRIKSRR